MGEFNTLTMDWKVGQNVVCDRPEQLLTGCVIQSKDADTIVISCPSIDLVFRGKQQQLEQLGWKVVDSKDTKDAREGKDVKP